MQLEDSSILSLINNKPVMAVTAVAAPEEDGVKGGGEVVVGMEEEEEEEVVNATNSSEENNNSNKGREEEGGGGGGDDGGDKMSFGGNRWPRQETLALLKIRSDMDSVFRDSTLKGPLWEEVSRKLGEIGYKRSAKKCKEKFENVYKYHKRTKEGRTGKSEGKTYKFFDQLQALENHNQFNTNPPPKSSQPLLPANPTLVCYSTLPSTTLTAAATTNNISSTTFAPHSFPNNNSMNLFSSPSSSPTSPSSSTASDEGLEERYKKKRKWKDYFRKLTRQVLAKQEEMQNRFLEAIDRRERERVAQEEAWRLQEMSRIANEHDVLVQERSTAAAKDAAVIALLHKLSGHETQLPQTQIQIQTQIQVQKPETIKAKNSSSSEIVERMSCSSSSRWPKGEVHALIRLRTSLDSKYMENGPKAPLWEDISGGMQRLGYNRSAKRCKEKWENINKYFKKVKESNKQRREDSKTCPYFHELEALYKDKISNNNNNTFGSFQNNMEPLMVQPEQQWRPPPEPNKDNNNASNEEEEEEEYDDDGVEEEEDGDSVGEEEEGGLNRYQIVTNKVSSVDTVE